MTEAIPRLAETLASSDKKILPTDHDAVMEKVNEAGQIIRFSILKVSVLKSHPPLAITLKK